MLRWGGGGNLIPNLEKIANDNVSFSINDKFGGISQVFGVGGTASGIMGYLCGIPQNRFIKSFLVGATCISDILKDLGYKQSFIGGTDFSFAGQRDFLQTHNIEVMDLKYFQNKNILPKKLPQNMQGVWDLKDVKTFELAKKHLEQISGDSPFALFISTIDTHEPRGYVDKEYCPHLDNTYESAYLCTDSIVSDFVAYLQNSKFKENTTIIILGDHLKRTDFVKMPPGSKTIYNAFINAKWSKTPTKTLTKGRLLSHFDITPLILDSIGLRVESFALGRNPLYGNSLLENEFYSIGDFNAILKLRNKVYDDFWIGK